MYITLMEDFRRGLFQTQWALKGACSKQNIQGEVARLKKRFLDDRTIQRPKRHG